MKEKGRINIDDIESKDYQSDLQTYKTSDGINFRVAYYPPNNVMLSNVVTVFAWEGENINKVYITYYLENGERSGNCKFNLLYWREHMK